MSKRIHLAKLAVGLAVLSLLAVSGPASAGSDAGAQIRRYQDETLRRLAPSASSNIPPTPPTRRSQAAASASDARIWVSGFSVHGVTRFSQDEIDAALKPYVDKELDTAGIHAAADAVNGLYRQAGYFIAKVFIPPQETAGSIRLDVYEGYLDTQGIEVINRGQRIDSSVVQGILEANIDVNAPIRSASYERALLIAEDLPGVTTSSTLYPGEHIGTARLRTELRDLPLVSGNLDLDNFGNSSTGQTRLGTTLYLNSPSRTGDQAVARLVTSGDSSDYAYLTYLRPVSSYGTRLGISVDYLGYKTKYINNVGLSDGHASDVRLYITHPIVRSRHGNLNFRTDVSQVNIDDRNDLNINARRQINSLSVALHGDDDHPWLGTGLSLFDASIVVGRVAVEGNASYLAIDQAGAQTAGSFSRFNFNISRLQQLSNHWSVFGKINAQIASGNLDSSQKFYLGGATSVSGYPLGEAGGDQGWELMTELRHDFFAPWGGTLQGGLFYQQGWLKNHKHPWNNWQGTNTNLENDITLKSIGLSAVQTLPNAWVLRGVLSRQVGTNQARDPITGLASDGSRSKYRIWFQTIRYF